MKTCHKALKQSFEGNRHPHFNGKKALLCAQLLISLLLLFTTISVLAETDSWSTCTLNSIPLSISLPSDFITIYEDMPEDDEAIKMLGLNYQEINEYFKDPLTPRMESYFPDGHAWLTVSAQSLETSDQSLLSEVWSQIDSTFQNQLTALGATVTCCKKEAVKGKEFLLSEYTLSNTHTRSYMTFESGSTIAIGMATSDVAFTSSDVQLLEEIVSRTVFSTESTTSTLMEKKDFAARKKNILGDLAIYIPDNWASDNNTSSHVKYRADNFGTTVIGTSMSRSTLGLSEEITDATMLKDLLVEAMQTTIPEIVNASFSTARLDDGTEYIYTNTIPFSTNGIQMSTILMGVLGRKAFSLFYISGILSANTEQAWLELRDSIKSNTDNSQTYSDDEITKTIIENSHIILNDGMISIPLQNHKDYLYLTRDNSFQKDIIEENGLTVEQADEFMDASNYDFAWIPIYSEDCMFYLRINEARFDSNLNLSQVSVADAEMFLSAFSSAYLKTINNTRYIGYKNNNQYEFLTIINGDALIFSATTMTSVSPTENSLKELIKIIENIKLKH